MKRAYDLTVEEVERLYKTNLVAPTLFAAAFGNARISTRDAVFCAVSSVAAQRPEPRSSLSDQLAYKALDVG